jgi:hypothetical protein
MDTHLTQDELLEILTTMVLPDELPDVWGRPPRAWIESRDGSLRVLVYQRISATTVGGMMHVLTGSPPKAMMELLHKVLTPEPPSHLPPPDRSAYIVRQSALHVYEELAARRIRLRAMIPYVTMPPHNDIIFDGLRRNQTGRLEVDPDYVPRQPAKPPAPTWVYRAQ